MHTQIEMNLFLSSATEHETTKLRSVDEWMNERTSQYVYLFVFLFRMHAGWEHKNKPLKTTAKPKHELNIQTNEQTQNMCCALQHQLNDLLTFSQHPKILLTLFRYLNNGNIDGIWWRYYFNCFQWLMKTFHVQNRKIQTKFCKTMFFVFFHFFKKLRIWIKWNFSIFLGQ